jgi:hypothetical protein
MLRVATFVTFASEKGRYHWQCATTFVRELKFTTRRIKGKGESPGAARMIDLFHEFRVNRLLQVSTKGAMKLIPSRT